MKFFAMNTMLAIGLTASFASANCSDEALAECGDFTVVSTTCPIFSNAGEMVGAKQFYSASYSDTSELPPMLGPSVELSRVARAAGSNDDVYSASLTSETDVFVVVSTKKGPKQNVELSYSTYTTSRGQKSIIRQCVPAAVK